MAKKESMFRKSSLKKLASPEQLDKLIKVTDSKAWLSLIAGLSLVASLILWSILGSLETTVRGSGILVKSGGIRSIQHPHAGTVTDIAIREGEIVEKGDVVARVAANSLLMKIADERFNLEALGAKLEREKQYTLDNTLLQTESFQISESDNAEQLSDLDRDISDQKEKLAEAVENSLESAKVEQHVLDQLEAERESLLKSMKTLEIEKLAFEKRSVESLMSIEGDIFDKREELKFLQDQLEEKSKITSLFSGRVLSINIEKGSMINAGESLVEVELEGRDIRSLEATIFIPALDAKKISAGDIARISPSTVKADEYGLMIGRVTKISAYPVSIKHISKTLGEEVAKNYLSMANPMEVVIVFIPNPNNPSGFKWSSKEGPPIRIETGTLAEGSVVISRQRPITLVFPILSRILD